MPAEGPDTEHPHNSPSSVGTDVIDPVMEPSVSGTPPKPGFNWRSLRRRLIAATCVAVAGLAWWCATSITLDYYVLAPGKARDVGSLVTVEGAEQFVPEGELLFTTVSVRRATPALAVWDWFDDDSELAPVYVVDGLQSPDDAKRANQDQMSNAISRSSVVAQQRLGYTVTEQGRGAFVLGVEADGPSDGVLIEGDIIVKVEDVDIEVVADLQPAVRANPAGTEVTIEVRRADLQAGTEELITRQITLGFNPDAEASYIGVVAETFERTYDSPVTVRINSGDVGGPSAGLAFTLAIIDQLTEGDLTGGRTIAVTGTIELDGTVGPISGAEKKVVAARERGAIAFIVPSALTATEKELLRRRAGDMRIIEVATLDEAIAAMGELGGDVSSIPAPPEAAVAP